MRQPPAFFTVPLLVLVEEVKGKKEAKKRYDTGGGRADNLARFVSHYAL